MDTKESSHLLAFGEEHIPLGMRLKQWAKWNQVEADWKLLLSMSRGGAFVGTYNDKKVGTLVTVTYNEAFSWIGMVLVDPRFRGKGIGTLLLKAAIEYALPVGPVLLDATAMGQPLYHSLGFQNIGEIARLALAKPVPIAASSNLIIKVVQSEHLASMITYDQEKVTFNRAVVIEDFFQRTPEYALVAYQNERLVGYCLGRVGSRFEHIGPLVADNREVAKTLLSYALAAAPQRALIMDVPLQSDWYAWLLQQGFAVQRLFTRMCLGDQRKADDSLAQYAIAGPALG